MTPDQAIAFAIILLTIGLFVWGRLPYDLVALLALLAGVLTGVVPARHAFDGFSDDIVVIIAAALVISTGIARSGAIETLMRPLLRTLRTERAQVPALTGAVAVLSVFSKNVGALAIFLPVALQLARRTGTAPAALLMPMSFASLLGGLVTLVGTSPNIIVSQVRADMLGHPFGMFSFTPVGLSIAVAGVLFLSFGYRLVPRGRRGAATMDAAFTLEAYTAQATLPPDSPMAGRRVAELEAAAEGGVRVALVLRERFRRHLPRPDWRLLPGDVLLLQGEPEDLERLVARARLRLAGERHGEAAQATAGTSVVEAVIASDSPVLGRSPAQAGLRDRYGLLLLALSRRAGGINGTLDSVRFRQGDVVVLKGASEELPAALGALHALPLAERRVALGSSHRGWLPALVLLAAMALVGAGVLPIAIAFLGAAVLLVLARVLSMHEAYASVEWSLLILIGALIPLSQAVRRTGGTELIAGGLMHVLQSVPAWGALAVVLATAMVVTPFLHNAPTVLMLGPVAATLAGRLHLNPDAFLMAVALGAGCDFLTPVGHQCNTLVYGPGGYAFGDYWRLGLPLSLLVIALGAPMIVLVWGL